MQRTAKHKYFEFIAFMLMASTFLPLLFNNLPPFVKSHHIWTVIWGISLITSYLKIFSNKTIKHVLVYGLIMIISMFTVWNQIDDWNFQLLINEFYNIFIGASVIAYFFESKDYFGLARITRWSIIFLFITAIMTIISSTIDPMYARNIVGMASVSNEAEIESILSLRYLGGGNYSTALSFMCLFPVFFYFYKNTGISIISKRMIIITSIVFFLALSGMQIFTNVLIAIVIIIISIIGIKKLKQSIMGISLLLFIIIFTPNEVFVNGINSIGGYFKEGSELNYKFTDLARFIEIGSKIEDKTTTVGLRGDRYFQLSESFFQSPLLGCYFLSENNNAHGYLNYNLAYGKSVTQVEGTHLHWMNKLTVTGLFIFVVFFYILYSFLKNNINRFNSTYKFYYVISSLALLSYGLFKTFGGKEAWYTFFILLPGIYYLPLLKKGNSNFNLNPQK